MRGGGIVFEDIYVLFTHANLYHFRQPRGFFHSPLLPIMCGAFSLKLYLAPFHFLMKTNLLHEARDFM